MFLSITALAAAMALGTGHIAGADTLTGRSIADSYVKGDLDQRIEELGTNLQTGEHFPEWKSRQNGGLKRHCYAVYADRGVNATGCAESFERNGK